MSQSDQSRNSWIKKDDPKLVSARCKDGYEDVLADIRGSYDTKYITQKYCPDSYKYNHSRTPSDIKEDVLNSDRVRYAIDQVCKSSHRPYGDVQTEAKSILDEMSHNQNIWTAKGFTFILAKIFKTLHSHIYINEEGLNRIRQLIQEYPVLFLPTHRSYLDFLLMSYMCIVHELPLPCIASAMDFLGMKLVATLLRNCGAFFIRRTFGGDQLYWAVFTEYVQTQINNGDSPIEFFVEGTRSRTSKSYYPRTGMLSASLEPYFKAHLPDIMIVPVSISYDRVLEETLYAYELLGVPKPKESTSGLIKARKVLNEDFGSIHMHYGEPISIRHYSTGRIDRISHSLAPRYIASLTKDETELIKSLSLHIVRTQQCHMVISPWSLMAAVLMQTLDTGIYVRQLVKEVEWLKEQAQRLGAHIDWPANESWETVIRGHLRLHRNIARVNEHDLVELLLPAAANGSAAKVDRLMEVAAQHLMLAMYRNQITHVFVRVAMIALVVNSWPHPTLSLDDLYKRYKFLENLFRYDFIFEPEESRRDFDNCVMSLTHTNIISLSENEIDVKKSLNKYTMFFSKMFEPFLLAYWVLAQHLLSVANDIHGKPLAKPSKTVVKEAQMLASMLIRDQQVSHYEILSLDVLNNGLSSLLAIAAVVKEKRAGINYLFANGIVLSKLAQDIGKLIEVPVLRNTRINVDQQTVTINSKL